MTMPPCPAGSSELEVTKHYLNACVDPDVRQTVTVQTQMDDVEDVWTFSINHPQIDPTRALIWAHSEGCGNTARLIGAGRICPRGVIFVGTATESAAGLVRWQMVDRYAEQVMRWDADGDGRVTGADLDRQYPSDQLFPAAGQAATAERRVDTRDCSPALLEDLRGNEGRRLRQAGRCPVSRSDAGVSHGRGVEQLVEAVV
jgi:hypothetical protein